MTASHLLKSAGRPARPIAYPAWREAREKILARAAAGPGLIALLGPPGTGKSILLRDLATTFGERGRTVCLLDVPDSSPEIGAAEIVLVDEADRVSVTWLDELRSLGGIVVVAAIPENREHFECYPNVTIVQLATLSPEEACAFVAERLAQLGLPNDCLTISGWARLIAHSHGVPRLLVVLLGLALFFAGEERTEHVTGAHVEEAVEAQGGSIEASTVEPVRAEADITPQSVSEIQASGDDTSTNAMVSWISEPPPHFRSRRAAAMALLAAIYLVPTAALMTWSVYQPMSRTASSGSDAAGKRAVRTGVLASTSPGTGQSAAVAPTAAVSTPPTVGTGPVGQHVVSPAARVPPISPPSLDAAMEPGTAASRQPVPPTEAPTTVAAATPNLPSASRTSSATAQQAGTPAFKPTQPTSLEAAQSLPPDRGIMQGDASETDQGSATLAISQLTELDAKIASRTRDVAALTAERDRLRSQISDISNEIIDATRRLSQAREHILQAENSRVSLQHITPVAARQAIHRVPFRELPSMPPRTSIGEAPSAVKELLSARKALIENNSTEARGLLEAAQTSIVFAPGNVASERTSVAAAQITEALSRLNSGDAVRALPPLNQAIMAIRPTF